LNDDKRVSNKNWTMLLFYRSFLDDMVSQQKTRLAKLRALLGPMGSESRFPQLVGLSASWVKKASAGNLPMTTKAATAIHYATGCGAFWLLGDSLESEPFDHKGNPYTIESYLEWKQFADPISCERVPFINSNSLRYILKVLAFNKGKKTQLQAAIDLFEFAQKFRTKYGAAWSPGKYGREMLANLLDISESFGDLSISEDIQDDGKPIGPTVRPPDVDGAPFRKKQPSRKSKRPA
jgi:hypothetical protein